MTKHKTEDRPVVIVGGPTASGKSALALDLAEALDGVVINADSMQVYRDLAIVTARPGPEDLARAPHRLYGTVDGDERCSAARWRDMAVTEIDAAHADGRLPIVAGGTGLYLRALTDGLSDMPDVPEAVRAEAVAQHSKLGGTAFHAALAERDPVMARRLEPGDSQRLVRAWEVLEATGRSLAEWQAEPVSGPPRGCRFRTIVLVPPREPLYSACDLRFATMMEAGAVAEVAALLARRVDRALPVMKVLGVPEIGRFLAGEIDLDTAIAQAQQATRRYAKRQLTWFRNQVLAQADESIHALNAQYSQSFKSEILSIIRDWR